MDVRLSSGRWPDHDNGYPARVKQAARHGAVELGGRHVDILGDIVDAVDKSRALSTISRRVGRNLGGSAVVSPCLSSFRLKPLPTRVAPIAWRGRGAVYWHRLLATALLCLVTYSNVSMAVYLGPLWSTAICGCVKKGCVYRHRRTAQSNGIELSGGGVDDDRGLLTRQRATVGEGVTKSAFLGSDELRRIR